MIGFSSLPIHFDALRQVYSACLSFCVVAIFLVSFVYGYTMSKGLLRCRYMCLINYRWSLSCSVYGALAISSRYASKKAPYFPVIAYSPSYSSTF